MNLNQLKYFLAIVKTGSFSNAADDMYISQSSMSKQIKALETELGVDLFKREHSKVYLTEIGAEFAKYAEMTIKQHNDMLLYLDEFATKKSNTIHSFWVNTCSILLWYQRSDSPIYNQL